MTAFPADAESNLFEGPYPEFFRALAHFAYPGDVRRIREAHSGWSEPREYPPLYDVQCGWDAPKTGKAFKILWLKCEAGSVRAWRRRRAQDWTMLDPCERIDPNKFRTHREEAERRMRLPPRQRIPVVEGYQLVGELPLGEGVDPQNPGAQLLPHSRRQRGLPDGRGRFSRRRTEAGLHRARRRRTVGDRARAPRREEERRGSPKEQALGSTRRGDRPYHRPKPFERRHRQCDNRSLEARRRKLSGGPDVSAVRSAAQSGRNTSAPRASTEGLKTQIDSIVTRRAFASE